MMGSAATSLASMFARILESHPQMYLPLISKMKNQRANLTQTSYCEGQL